MPPSWGADRIGVSLGSHRPTVILKLPCLVEKKRTKVRSLAVLFSAANWDRSPARNSTNPLVDKSDDSAAVRNGVYRLVDLIFRGQYIPKGALVIFDGLNKELCVGIHLVVIRIVHLGRKSGWLFCALYLKQAASSLMMAYGGDEFVHPDNAVPVYLARSGYPRIIPSHHRRMILNKDEKADMLKLGLGRLSFLNQAQGKLEVKEALVPSESEFFFLFLLEGHRNSTNCRCNLNAFWDEGITDLPHLDSHSTGGTAPRNSERSRKSGTRGALITSVSSKDKGKAPIREEEEAEYPPDETVSQEPTEKRPARQIALSQEDSPTESFPSLLCGRFEFGIAAEVSWCKNGLNSPDRVVLFFLKLGSVVRRPIKWLKPSSHRLEPQGGILVLWKSKDISVDVLQDDSQFVHMKVVPEKKSECLLIALYAKPTESLKAWLWKQVLQMWEV
ncbi:hypothetical protein QL285_097489 [Trifolium repens]|nr:hypothetical protein QL285_097489 [Trifolium repens]